MTNATNTHRADELYARLVFNRKHLHLAGEAPSTQHIEVP